MSKWASLNHTKWFSVAASTQHKNNWSKGITEGENFMILFVYWCFMNGDFYLGALSKIQHIKIFWRSVKKWTRISRFSRAAPNSRHDAVIRTYRHTHVNSRDPDSTSEASGGMPVLKIIH